MSGVAGSAWHAWAALALAGGVTFVPIAEAALGTGAVVDSPIMLLVGAVTSFLLGAWTQARVALPAVLVAAVGLTVASQWRFSDEYPVADDLVFFLLVLAGPAVVGASLVARTGQVRELSRLSARLATQRDDDLRAARLEEQQRIELVVHRRLVEQMGAIALRAEGARHTVDPEMRQRALEDVEATARTGLAELRKALGVLRDPVMEASPEIPESPASGDPPGRADLLVAVGCGAAMAIESLVSSAARGAAWLGVLAGFVMAAPLAFRRQAPIAVAGAVFVLAIAASSKLTPLPEMVTAVALLLVLSYAVGAHGRGWWRLLGLAVIWLGEFALVVVSPPGAREPDGLMPSLIWSGLAVAAGALTAGWSSRAERMGHVVAELEHGREVALRVAVARQRNEMARDLHDSVAHTMTVVCVRSGAARRVASSDPSAVEEALETIVATSRTGMSELRGGLDALDQPPGSLESDALTAMARSMGVEVEVEVDFMTSHRMAVPPPTAALLHRVLRETFVNAARHAPGARVVVRLEARDDRINLMVADNGQVGAGFDLGTGSGLTDLAAVVRAHGGRLERGSLPGGGFRVSLTLPTPARSPA